MKKKKILVGLVALTAALGLASCAENGTTPGTDPNQQQTEKTLSSIAVTGGKTQFTVGEAFSQGSLVVTATYSDGTTADVTSSATVTSTAVNTAIAGTYTVTVSYEGKEASYTVTVSAAEKVLSEIEVTTTGVKTEYQVGETLSTTGLVVSATYNTGKETVALTACTITVAAQGGSAVTGAFAAAGTYTVTVSYGGKTDTYDVVVTAVEKTLNSISVDDLNATTVYELGSTISYEGLIVTAVYNTGSESVELSDCTMTVTDPSGAAVTGAFAAAGAHTVTVTYGEKTATYTVTVTDRQVLVTHEYNTSAIAPLDTKTNVTLATDTELFSSAGTTIKVGPADGGRVYQQVYETGTESSSKEYNGVTYNGRIQLGGSGNASKTNLAITTTGACTVKILAMASGENNDRYLQLGTQQFITNHLEIRELTYDIPAAGTYYLYSTSSGINIYDIQIQYSYNASDVEENASMGIAGYETEFTTQGDTVFNLEAPQGLKVYSYNNKGGRTELTTGYTISLKQGENTVTAITTPGEYIVVVAITGTELSQEYAIVVTNPNATVESVEISENTSVTKVYDTDLSYSAEDIHLTLKATDSDGLVSTIDPTQYEISILGVNSNPLVANNGVYTLAVENADVTYTVRLSYEGKYAEYTVTAYARTSTEIVAQPVTVVQTGSTSYATDAIIQAIYSDGTRNTVDAAITTAYYSDAACTTPYADATAAFAAAGTVYIKLSAANCTDVTVRAVVGEATLLSESLVVATYTGETAIDAAGVFSGGTDSKVTTSGTFTGYSLRLQTGGKLTKAGRYLKINVSGPCTILLKFRGGGTSARSLYLYNAAGYADLDDKNYPAGSLATLGADLTDTSVLTTAVYEYSGEADSLYVGGSNGFDIYEVIVVA